EKLKKSKDVKVTLTKFNDIVDIVYSDIKVKDVPKLDEDNYQPNHWTALYDAIGLTVKKIENKLKGNDKALVVIFTDGYENSSKEYKRADIIKIITDKQNSKNWTFVYLGADQDAWAVSEGLGITRGNTVSFNKKNTDKVMNRVATASMGYTTLDSGYQESLMEDYK